jgi:hypothetical protein
VFKKFLFLIALSGLVVNAKAAPASTPLDESAIEQDLEEDDGSFVPDDDAAQEIPSETPVPAEPEPAPDLKPAPETYRASGSSGEKIFDWSKHRGETQVKHPFAEKGLIRIGKDKAYYYKVNESEQKRAASMHVGLYDPVNLSNPDSSYHATFAENYDQSSNPTVIFEYEWQGWRNPFGKFGIRAGTGVFVAQGHGHFVEGVNANLVPREQFTFVAMPNTLGVIYRMHIWHKQLFVPYAEGGGIAFTFGEFRDDDKAPKWGGALALYGAAGLAVNLTYFDYMTRTQLDREYGINACYLTVEYRHVASLSQRFDFTSDFFNGGFLVEF